MSSASRSMSESASTEQRFDPAALDTGSLMQTLTGRHGVDIRDRYYLLRKYKACFLGNALVDLFVSRYKMSRRQATRAGQRLLAQGLICHVIEEHDFKDAPLFYAIGQTRERREADEPVHLSNESLASLVHAMQGPEGITVGRNRRRLVNYPQCFVAGEAVSWIAQHTQSDREQATRVGRALLKMNFIRHVFDEKHFEDGRSLYRFV